jgi:CheY-like chemotaxis protein
MSEQPRPPFPAQQQPMPGATAAMDPRPDHGENSYKGSRKLKGLKAVITGADSGIGRAVAIAFAREGADVLIAYLNEDEDARETQRLVEEAGRKAVLVAGDINAPAHCRAIIDRCVKSSATSEQPGLILMELTLPDMDGKEATRRIKSEPITQRIPIIALTENAMSSDREKAIAACSRPVMTSTPAGRSRRPQPQPRYWSRAGQPFAPRKLRAAAREVQRRTLAPPCDFQSN